MAMNDGLMAEVDQRANLAFSNQMEMLTFYLSDRQQYGINVFKIIEILECPHRLTRMPYSPPAVVGTIDFRGHPVNVIDLSLALALPAVDYQNKVAYIIVCEYSNSTQGFLINQPNKLVNKSWEEIMSPSGMLSQGGCLTAITYDENKDAIQILDVEKILSDIVPIDDRISDKTLRETAGKGIMGKHVLVIDDSKAARSMIKSALDQMNIEHTPFDSAQKALAYLRDPTRPNTPEIGLIICDIEMPGLDGFTFTRQVKSDARLAGIHLVLHSSLSNPSNQRKAEQVGANGFIAKFQPDALARMVREQLGEG